MITTMTVNETVKLYFQSTTGITDFSLVKVFNNGVEVTSPNIAVVESTVPGIYVVTYTPSATGRGLVLFDALVVAHTEVVAKSLYSFLKNIEDESLGSWTWDKQAGTLRMIKQDGSPLASFDVIETLTVASRERTS